MGNLQKLILFIGIVLLLLFIFGIIFSFAFIRNFFESGIGRTQDNVTINVSTPTLTGNPSVATTVPVTTTPTQNAATNVVKIYFIALEDDGRLGQRVGCGDSVVAVEKNITPTSAPLRAALEELLGEKQRIVTDANLYNSLYQSSIQIENVNVDAAGTANVSLRGDITLGGTCDSPRLESQLKSTILQFNNIKTANITINGTPIEEALSQR